MKCKYCENTADKHVVWLYDKNHRPARIQVPWCGCDLMTALKRFWQSPYQIREGIDYEIIKIDSATSANAYSFYNISHILKAP